MGWGRGTGTGKGLRGNSVPGKGEDRRSRPREAGSKPGTHKS